MSQLPQAIRRVVDGQTFTIDSTGMSGAQVLLYPELVLKIRPASPATDRECAYLRWLDGRVPSPRIVESVQQGGMDYLLMTRLRGRMLCEDEFLDHPSRLCELLAEAMQLIHRSDASGCPVDRRLDVLLAEAEQRVARGDLAQADFSRFGSAEKLLVHLQRSRPDDARAVPTHGDCCLPNILADEKGVCGLIDLGGGGLGDPYEDYACAHQSLMRNMTGFFGGHVRSAPDKNLLFECLGVTPDWEHIEYYLLLDMLFC